MTKRDHHAWSSSEEAILWRAYESGTQLSVLAKNHLRSIRSIQDKLEELGLIPKVVSGVCNTRNLDSLVNDYEPGQAVTVEDIEKHQAAVDAQIAIEERCSADIERAEEVFQETIEYIEAGAYDNSVGRENAFARASIEYRRALAMAKGGDEARSWIEWEAEREPFKGDGPWSERDD